MKSPGRRQDMNPHSPPAAAAAQGKDECVIKKWT